QVQIKGPLTFYFDRNFGKRFPLLIRAARPPFVVEFHHDPSNRFRFRHDTPDDIWMSKVGAEGWIVFSHDRKWHTELPVYAAIKQHKVACFYLAGGSTPVWDKLHCLMRGYEGIRNCIRTNRAPYIFDVAYNGRLTRVPIP
ncbi:MAG: hypothetical protein ACJ8ED_22720, partial [Xanthobacteraceae bacterium]